MKFLLIALLFLSLHSNSQNVLTLPVNEFEQKLNDAKVQLLDVRKADEYKAGHLRGAFLADWLDKKQFEEKVQYLDKTKPVYVYCLAGSRSAAAANWLVEKGFTNVVNMQGGIIAWKKENRPMEINEIPVQMKEEEYIQQINSNVLVLVDFGASWCIPCKKMEPVIESFLKDNTAIKLVKVDAGIDEAIMKKYEVDAPPVFILYKNGIEVWRQVGVAEKKEFEKALKKLK